MTLRKKLWKLNWTCLSIEICFLFVVFFFFLTILLMSSSDSLAELLQNRKRIIALNDFLHTQRCYEISHENSTELACRFHSYLFLSSFCSPFFCWSYFSCPLRIHSLEACTLENHYYYRSKWIPLHTRRYESSHEKSTELAYSFPSYLSLSCFCWLFFWWPLQIRCLEACK